MNYGVRAYVSPRPSNFKILDPVHHLGLRQGTGAVRTPPTTSLYAGSEKIYLEKIRYYHSYSYFFQVLFLLSYAEYSCLQDSTAARSFSKEPSIIKTWACDFKVVIYFLRCHISKYCFFSAVMTLPLLTIRNQFVTKPSENLTGAVLPPL